MVNDVVKLNTNNILTSKHLRNSQLYKEAVVQINVKLSGLP